VAANKIRGERSVGRGSIANGCVPNTEHNIG